MSLQKVLCRCPKPCLLARVHRLRRAPEVKPPAKSNLDKNGGFTLLHDQINLAERAAIVVRQE